MSPLNLVLQNSVLNNITLLPFVGIREEKKEVLNYFWLCAISYLFLPRISNWYGLVWAVMVIISLVIKLAGQPPLSCISQALACTCCME